MSRSLKHICCALIAAISVASCKKIGSQNATNVGKEVLELERAWGQAYVKGDKDFVDRLLAPEWRGWTDREGSDKAAAMAEFKPGSIPSLENVIDDARVRVYGDAAVVQARERVRFRTKRASIGSPGTLRTSTFAAPTDGKSSQAIPRPCLTPEGALVEAPCRALGLGSGRWDARWAARIPGAAVRLLQEKQSMVERASEAQLPKGNINKFRGARK